MLSRTLAAMEEPPGVRELIAAAISEESGEIIRAGYSSSWTRPASSATAPTSG
jgi:hypothetical protein